MTDDRHNWESDPGGLFVCMTLVEKSAPFDAGQKVELKFHTERCHGILYGSVSLVFAPDEAAKYFVGDSFSLRVRMI